MALDFPANPTNGQAYGSYIYNSAVGAWQSKEDPATVAVTSPTAPASANNGDIWYNSNSGVSYVYYDDGTSAQWVEIVSSALPALDSKADITGDTFTGNVTAPRFISNIATGTAPLGVTSTTIVSNLNADLLDGQHGSVYSPAGMVSQFAGSAAPTGWLLCDGSAVSRTTYAALFAAIGTTYGTGDNSTTFNIPNLKGKVPVGRDAADTNFDQLNTPTAYVGAKTHTLTVAEMPSHTHVQNSHNHTQDAHNHTQNAHTHTLTPISGQITVNAGSTYGVWGQYGTQNSGSTTATNNATTATNQATTATNQNTGGGGAHNNLQPYIVMNYIIRV